VHLDGAKVTGQVSMIGASFDGTLDATNLQVGGDLYMYSSSRNWASFKNVSLLDAKIGGQISMTVATLEGKVKADSLQVGGDLFMRDIACTDQILMVFAHVGGGLDLRGAALAGLNLSGASIATDLALGEPGKPAIWKGKKAEPDTLTMRNTHIGNLVDVLGAWPKRGHLHLDGFTFNHLGGLVGERGPEMRARGMEWWDDWARRDPDYSPTPYQQLAAALTNAGDRDAANEIRYLGRVRERETEKGLSYIWSGFLQWVAGFGIGTYTFRVLWWVIGISLLGAFYLKTRVKGVRDGNHGFFWCFGASLSRLLPVIEINKEFSDFFNDSKRERLTGFQSAVFSIIGIIGFVLGAVLVAAVSGLTQNP
jgi:hypothetical protein